LDALFQTIAIFVVVHKVFTPFPKCHAVVAQDKGTIVGATLRKAPMGTPKFGWNAKRPQADYENKAQDPTASIGTIHGRAIFWILLPHHWYFVYLAVLKVVVALSSDPGASRGSMPQSVT
jgi:hypothetical protein